MSRKTLPLPRRRTLRALRAVRDDTRPVALFLYTRISNDQEGRELGVKRQHEDLHESVARDYPDANDVHVFDGYCDNDRSASTNCDTPRPDYDRLLRDAREAAESGKYRKVEIRAYTSSRLTRRPREYEDQIDLAQDYEVEFEFLRSPSFNLNTAAGRRIGRTMAAQDAGLPEDISEQVLRKRDQQLINGEFTGGKPGFGFRLEYDYNQNGLPIKPGRLVIHEDEAELIRDAVNRLLAGEELADIAARWAAATGKKRWPADVADILQRGRLAGLNERYGEVWGRGQWGRLADENDPDSEWCSIISESELAAVRARLNERTRAQQAKQAKTGASPGGYPRRWLGAGKYRCGQPGCTSTMRSTGPAKKGYGRRYMCKDGSHCTIDAAMVDKHVRGDVCAYLARYGANLLAGGHAEEHERLTRQANKLRLQIEALSDAFAEADHTDPKAAAKALAIATGGLATRLQDVEDKRKALVDPSAALESIADADDPVAAFLDAPLSRQRAVMEALFTVTIKPGRPGRRPAGAKLTDRIDIALRTGAPVAA